MNSFLDFYGEKHISPVRQNIDDISVHIQRRKKLHRQVGIPYLFFKDAQILEVGPGSGYNSLWYILVGGEQSHIDLVEANPIGVNDMKELFCRYNIEETRYTIFQKKIEDYKTDKNYDFIVAEGFLQYLDNQMIVIEKLKKLSAAHGVIMVTCSDDVCLYIELMKRLIGILLTKDIDDYDSKVECLLRVFGKTINSLRGASRVPVDYIQDNFLNPSWANGNGLSLIEAIKLFGDEFDVLGTSPSMFLDYSWYKDVAFDYKKSYEEQYKRKNMSLLMANMEELIVELETADKMVQLFGKIKEMENIYEHDGGGKYLTEILKKIGELNEMIIGYNEDLTVCFLEIEHALKTVIEHGTVDMEMFPHFSNAFGRTQQYIAFEKK